MPKPNIASAVAAMAIAATEHELEPPASSEWPEFMERAIEDIKEKLKQNWDVIEATAHAEADGKVKVGITLDLDLLPGSPLPCRTPMKVVRRPFKMLSEIEREPEDLPD